MNWKKVCAVAHLAPRAITKFEIDGISFVVVKVGDTVKAFPPLCPHMEEPLERSGVCDDDGKLMCIKHLWNWNLGTGEPQGETERALLLYGVKIENGDVLVDLEKELAYDYDEDAGGDDDENFWKS